MNTFYAVYTTDNSHAVVALDINQRPSAVIAASIATFAAALTLASALNSTADAYASGIKAQAAVASRPDIPRSQRIITAWGN